MKKNLLKLVLLYIVVFYLPAYSQSNTDVFNVYLDQSFNDDTPGKYLRSEWAADWGLPYSYASDPRLEYWDSYGQLKIVAEGSNKFFRREVKAGESNTGSQKGCNWFVDIPDVNELYFSFRVRFPQSMFNQPRHVEGKIHGLYNPYSSSPVGEKPAPNTGFNTLMMFSNTHTNYTRMEMFLYIYYQEMTPNACASPYPVSACPESDKIYYGNYSPVNFYFQPDRWYSITQRLVMNDPYTSNGIIEIFIDGKLVASYNHYRFRDTEEVKIEYVEVSTFFGGGPEVSPAHDTYLDFDDFIAFNYKENVEVVKGTVKSTTGRLLWFPWQTEDPNLKTNNAPKINATTFNITDTASLNQSVGFVTATDADGDNLTYAIVNGNTGNTFKIDAQTGELKLSSVEFVPGTETFKLGVSVTDNASNPLTAGTTITVNVKKTRLIYYIDPDNSDDIYKNGSLPHPFSSWSEAVWKDNYSYLQKRGTTAGENKITIQADDVYIGAYGEGEKPVIKSTALDYAITAYEKKNITINGFHILADNAVSCIYFPGTFSSGNSVEECLLEGAENGIRIMNGENHKVSYCVFKGNGEGLFSMAKSISIVYNIFRENQTAVNISGEEAYADIFNNVFYENHTGTLISDAKMTLFNNIFYQMNGNGKALSFNHMSLVSDNNIFYPEKEDFISINNKNFSSLSEIQNELQIEINSLSDDPKFKDASADNFALDLFSPAINRGRYVGITKDFYGKAVPFDNLPDIGLSEADVSSYTNTVRYSEDADNIHIYPNPSSGKFNFSLSGNRIIQEISVADMSGKIVFKADKNLDFHETVDLSFLVKGFYFFTVRTTGSISTKKILIL